MLDVCEASFLFKVSYYFFIQWTMYRNTYPTVKSIKLRAVYSIIIVIYSEIKYILFNFKEIKKKRTYKKKYYLIMAL